MAIVLSNAEKAAQVVKTKNVLLGKNLGSLIDQLHDIRDRKRDLDKQLSEVEAEYRAIEEQLLERLDEEGTNKAGGSKATCSVSHTEVFSIDAVNREDFEKFIYRNKALHLLQNRLSAPACRELLERRGGKALPGITQFTKKTLNLRSV